MSDLGRSREFWKKVIGIIVFIVWLGSIVLTWVAIGVLERIGIDPGGLLSSLLILFGPILPAMHTNDALNAELERQFSPK